jgi:hypothetical protein
MVLVTAFMVIFAAVAWVVAVVELAPLPYAAYTVTDGFFHIADHAPKTALVVVKTCSAIGVGAALASTVFLSSALP